jgi:hypothetical protein
MTDEGRAAFREAVQAAQKRAEREGRKICHVKWDGAHLSVTTRPIDGAPEEPRGWEPQGVLL